MDTVYHPEQYLLPADRPFTHILKKLRLAGLRPTRQRLSLAKLLFDGEETRHVTAESLHEEAAEAGAKVSLATVYNTLHQFTAVDLLRQVVVDNQRTYFDTNIQDHHHLYDESQGILIDIPAQEVALKSSPILPAGTEIERVDVVFRISGKDA